MGIIKLPPANRRNASKTIGPRGAGSKIESRFNAAMQGSPAKTLISFDESPEGYARLSSEYHEQFLPANTVQHALVESLISNEWSLRRLRRTEVEIWEQVSDKLLADKDPGGAVTSGETFSAAAVPFERLQKVIERCERNYFRAARELERLQAPARKLSKASGRGSVLQFPKPAAHTDPKQ